MYKKAFGRIFKTLWTVAAREREKEQENVGHGAVLMESPPAGCDCLDKALPPHRATRRRHVIVSLDLRIFAD